MSGGALPFGFGLYVAVFFVFLKIFLKNRLYKWLLSGETSEGDKLFAKSNPLKTVIYYPLQVRDIFLKNNLAQIRFLVRKR